MAPYLDLQTELTSNVTFRNKADALLKKFYLAEKARDKKALAHYMQEILILCGGNPGLLVPYMFPVAFKNKPMELWSRPHTFAMYNMLVNSETTINASRQTGKCVHGTTRVIIKNTAGKVQETSIKDLFEES